MAKKNGEPAIAVNLRSVWLSRHYSPGAVVARIAREHDINDNLLFKWKSQYEDGLLSDDDIQGMHACPGGTD